MRLAILRTGQPGPALRARRGGYEHWFAARLGLDIGDIDLIDALTGDLPPPGELGGLIVTGSPHSVHDHPPWSVRATAWLRDTVERGVPTLAVCYGHQMLGEAYGGSVGPNPNGREIGTVHIDLAAPDDPLFADLPATLPVIATHSDAVNVPPPGVRVLAGNANNPVQAMAIGENCRTIQWHPEMDADIIRAIITERAAAIDAERGPGTAERIHDAVHDVDSGQVILRNFARHWLGL